MALRGSTDGKPTDEELKERFLELDENHDGMLSYEELLVMLRGGNPDITDDECRRLWNECDKDANGLVDFDEFVDFVFSGATDKPKKSKAQKAEADGEWDAATETFLAYAGFFQTDGDDRLNLREMISMLKDLYIIDDAFSEEDAEKVFKKCKKKKEKSISALQFRKVIKLIAKKKEKPVSLMLKYVGSSKGPRVSYAAIRGDDKPIQAEGYDLSFLDTF
mmetsp:Transcript_70087/g.121333  ORF Transcript_70087/g.121333 Transcript_70087/m.121333 type:complete len:220 (+) Transcript_70087:37-696(+)